MGPLANGRDFYMCPLTPTTADGQFDEAGRASTSESFQPSRRPRWHQAVPGIGREGSRHGIEEYVEVKYVCLGGLLPEAGR